MKMQDSEHVEETKQLNGTSDGPKDVSGGDIMERIISEVGEMGVYQRWLFVAMLPFFLTFVFVYCVQMFIAATPQQHWCKVPELQHLDVDLRRNLSIPGAADGPDWDRCHVYDTNWTHVLQTLTPPNATSKPCDHGWEFLFNDIPYATVVSEREWVCDRANNAPLAQSIFFMGSLVGCAFFGWMGDKFGRLPTFICANIVGCVGSVLTVFTQGVVDFTMARFLVGLSNDCCVMMLYLIVLEYVGPSHRTWVSNMSIALYCGGGSLLLVLLALWLRDWRQLVLITSLPMLGVLATPFYVPESARWLASKGKVDKAVEMLRKFEKINKKKISDESLNQFIVAANEATSGPAGPESLKDLSQSRPLRNGLVVLVLVGMIANVGLDAILRMSENIGTNFFLTFALSSAAEIPALILVTLILDRVGRRSLIVGTLAIAGVLSLFCGFSNSGVMQLVLAVSMRFAVNMTIGAHFQLTNEMMPTGMRARGSAIVHLAVYVAITTSPYIVFSGRYWSPLPLLIVGAMCMLAAGLALLLPETKGQPMPQTVRDAERLIADGALWKKAETKHGENLQMHMELAAMLEKNKNLDA